MQAAENWRCWVLIVALGVAGCETVPPPPGGPAPAPYVMLSPDSLGRSLSLTQAVTGDYGGQHYFLRFEVEIGPARLVMVGLSHLGVPLFSLEQDAKGFNVESFTDDQMPFDPRHILSDFQLANWPEEELRQALMTQGLRLEVDPDGLTRRLLGPHNDLLVEISHSARDAATDETVIQHFDRPYRLRIKTLEARETP